MMETTRDFEMKPRWDANMAKGIVRRYTAKGRLRFEEAVRFASGEAATVVDEVLLRDSVTGRPFLPGTTLAGALRSLLESRSDAARDLCKMLFGGEHKSREDTIMLESLLTVDDAVADETKVEIREGVRLDGRTRTAADGALYDAESWAPGLTFDVRLEVAIPDALEHKESDLLSAFATLLDQLTEEGLTLGARKRRGFGLARVEGWRLRTFDLSSVDDLIGYLRDSEPETGVETSAAEFFGVDHLPDERKLAELTAEFQVESSLLIRSSASESGKDPDMVHLRSGGEPILSGTTIAGGLRAQATRILSLVSGGEKTAALVDDLFGPSDLHKDGSDARASRVNVRTSVIENGVTDLVQHRVSIDRFTGGAFPGALFNQQPVMAGDSTSVAIRLKIDDPTDADLGLLLLLLKDLWTGNLPLGGERSVGRGRLRGRSAQLKVSRRGEHQEFAITSKDDGGLVLDDDAREVMEGFVAALHQNLNGSK
jgi:CRISPR/Cas system CSM-associated protein Csm3 (group 7 of RAMP superfamily)